MSHNGVIPFGDNRPLIALLSWLLFFWIVTAIDPLNRQDWILENILVVSSVLVVLFSYRRFRFSNSSYLLITVFLTLHLVGAHYTYAETPLGFWMQKWFGFERNHYDRLIHFSFGLLLAYPVRELLGRAGNLKSSWSSTVTVLVILSLGAVFEIFEMWAALLVSPELGAAYLGTQGDIWDAQQDMFQATLGAVCAMLILRLYMNRHGPRQD